MAKKDIETGSAGVEQGVELDANHAEPRVYELSFHIDPELPQEEAKKAYQTIRDLVASHGSVVTEGEIEKIPLAYTISRQETTGRRDFNSAYFAWVAYEATGEGHQEIVSEIRHNSKIFRFLDIRTTKDAAKHSSEMHEFYRREAQQQANESEDEEPAADAELDAALKEAGVEA